MTINKLRSLGRVQQASTGFSLVELMVALLVLAIGLLGLAGLQAKGLSNTHNAYLRTQAVLLAEDMADRMRANTGTGGLEGYLVTSPASTSCSSPCTAAQVAGNDLVAWHAALVAALPGGSATISQSSSVYTITISWIERESNSSSASVTKTLAMSFQPK